MELLVFVAALLGTCLALIHITTMVVLRTKPVRTAWNHTAVASTPPRHQAKKEVLKQGILFGVGWSILATLIITYLLRPEWFGWLAVIPRLLQGLWEPPFVAVIVGAALFMPISAYRIRLGMSWRNITVIAALAILAITFWVLYPGWLTVDILAALVTMVFALHMQFRMSFMSAWIASLLFAALYDVVQVFGTGQMLQLVEQVRPGAVALIKMGALASDELVLPLLFIVPETLDLSAPPAGVLGVGDIFGSVALMVIVARTGRRTGNKWLYRAALAGFAIGLLASLTCNAVFAVAQPATIYLFPAIGFAVMIAAWRSKLWKELRALPY